MRQTIAVLSACIMVFACGVSAVTQETSQSVFVPQGALVLVGGGANLPAYMQRFQELAGGPNAKIIVIPTSLDDDRFTTEGMAQLRAATQRMFGPQTTLLHTRDRKVADSPEFVAPLRSASGVWILGGNEDRLTNAYVGTRTETEIKALLSRGGVVGGTSAGAIIQGSIRIKAKLAGGADPDAVTWLGTIPSFNLLPSSVVIPHWSQRKLNFNLLAVETEKEPTRIGIGIDENTAAIVHGNTLEVLGEHQVGIYDGKQHSGKPFLLLSSGQKYDLKSRTLIISQ